MWFALPKFGEWFDLVSGLAGLRKITESKLLILQVNASGAHRLFILHFLQVLDLSSNPFLDSSALFRQHK
ncbi:hypothetical protein HVV73_06780 [Escherichia coli]|uniref:hypothetical protein n=1 Tax=Escherichia coli TaxID=562 RepID=UPI000DA7395B|nr:hypothetical protein [Escherichia coli]EFH7594139.1 hypothetical protein [Escherichia coli]EGK4102134.1 hypothetical protein [Escherichia coli]MBA8571244.1 hypothetical protein [Escherichia coli]QMQ17801.1 hypothetical protein HVV77_06780 [Escherichia coli]QMQ26464.1 hypothetical protein HVV73_06780 [Escherichia coli]